MKNPYDLYDFGSNFLELILKCADEINNIVEFPSVPSPQERLKEISDAIQNTVVENLNSRDSPTQKNNLALPLTAGDDKTTRYFKQVTNSAGTRTYVPYLCSEFMFCTYFLYLYVLYALGVRACV